MADLIVQGPVYEFIDNPYWNIIIVGFGVFFGTILATVEWFSWYGIKELVALTGY